MAARDGDTFEVKFALFSPQKKTVEKFDAGLKLRIVFYTQKTIKNQEKIFVSYTLSIDQNENSTDTQEVTHLLIYIYNMLIPIKRISE